MNQRRTLLVFATLVIVLGIAALFTVLVFRQPMPTPPRTGVLPAPGFRFPAPQAQREAVEEHAVGEVPKIAEKKAVFELFGTTIQIPTSFVEALRPLLPFAERLPAETAKKEAVAELPQKAPTEKLALTSNEVFRVLFPDFYISVLRKVQDILVGLGAISPTGKYSFSNEADVKKFNDIFFQFLRDRQAITEDDYKSYLEGASRLFDRPYEEKYREAQGILAFQQSAAAQEQPVLLSSAEAERQVEELLKSQGLPTTFELLPEPLTSSCVEQNKRYSSLSLSVAFLDRFLRAFLLEAQAISVNVGGILCFRSGTGSAGAGTNFVAPCCKCSIKKVPVGCLDICPSGALWDPITKICGCNAGGIAGP